ncbi:methyltransferase family protein [Aquisphaera insulae]|uniref:methyltransferase family protein n=1 Tax=Aquisphaera insulae TaxID=2712864 RepID=UPI0013EB2469|nr:isoprenylcysteine carboxylmethyltransferase family protein [Aquisphaera insulae]
MQPDLPWLPGLTWAVFLPLWLWPWHKRREAAASEPVASRVLHLVLVVAAVWIACSNIFTPLSRRWLAVWPTTPYLGLAILWGGIGFAGFARWYLGKNWNGRVAEFEDQDLISSGPYRVIRHPIYTGIFGMFLGAALFSGEIRGLVGISIAGFAFFRKIRAEEKGLLKRFKAEYSCYRHRTGLLFPKPSGWYRIYRQAVRRFTGRGPNSRAR